MSTTKLTKDSPIADLALMVAEEWEELRDKCILPHHPHPIVPPSTYGVLFICEGERGWTPTRDRDRIEAEVRERGWSIAIFISPDWQGDEIRIYNASIPDIEALAEESDGLRGTHAVLLAIARVLGKVA